MIRVRILHVIHSANPAGGGPIEGIKQLAAAKRFLGWKIEVACLDAPGSPWIADFPLTLYALGPSVGSYGYTPRLIPWLKRHHADYDAVVINGIWQYHSFATRRALRGTGTPYCVFTHGMLDPWFKKEYPLKHLKKWLYWPWGEYPVLRDAATVFFTAEEERRLARQSFWLYHCNETVVSYGTSGPVGDPVSQRALFLSQFPALADQRIVLFLGRIHEKKGCDLLIEAFHRLLSEKLHLDQCALVPNLPIGNALVCESPIRKPSESYSDSRAALHLVIAGPDQGAFATQLKAKAQSLGIAPRITWTGMLKGDLKWGAFHAAEVFILPSHQENFGIAVAEALACGLPVLIADKVNIWREIAQDNAGLVEADTLEGTFNLLKRWMLMDESARQTMRQNALACFEQRFEIAAAARALAAALAQIAGQ